MTPAYQVRDLVCRLGGRDIVRGVDLEVPPRTDQPRPVDLS